MASLIKKLAGQTAIYGLSSIIGRLLNYLLVPIYTRIFAPEEYGVVTELYAYVTFLLIILTYGMETGFFRFSQDKERFNKVYSTSLTSLFATSVVFVILINLFTQPIANWMEYGAHPEYIRWFGFILAIDAFSAIPFAKLRQQGKAWKFATVKLINIVTNIGFNLFFLLLCPKLMQSHPDSVLLKIYNPDIGVGYVFVSNLIASSLTLLLLLPEILNVKYSFRKKILREILWYSFPLLIGGLAGMMNETIDRILLRHLLPENVNALHQIGIYGANYKLAILMTLFIQMFRYAAEPFFFSQSKEKNSKELYARVLKYFTIFGLLIFLGITLYIDIFKYFIDPDYHEGLKVVPVLLLANLFLGIYFNLSIWYKLNQLTRFGAYMAIFGAIITISLNLVLIPIIGYMGSAWATLACYSSMTVLSYFLGRNFFPISYDLRSLFIYALIAGGIFVISLWSNEQTAWLKYLINTTLIAGFAFIALKKEGLLYQLKRGEF